LQRPGGFVIRCPLRTIVRLFLGSSAVEHSTVNRMVAGSNPARGANHFNSLAENISRLKTRCVRAVSSDALRRAAAFPLYVVALLPSLLGDAIGILAAKIAGDDWPR
jgi:hypothetical protein